MTAIPAEYSSCHAKPTVPCRNRLFIFVRSARTGHVSPSEESHHSASIPATGGGTFFPATAHLLLRGGHVAGGGGDDAAVTAARRPCSSLRPYRSGVGRSVRLDVQTDLTALRPCSVRRRWLCARPWRCVCTVWLQPGLTILQVRCRILFCCFVTGFQAEEVVHLLIYLFISVFSFRNVARV